MSNRKRSRKAKTQQQLAAEARRKADEADQRKRNALIAVGIPAAQVEGRKVDDFETNVRHIRRPVQSIVDRWFAEGGPGFDEPQQRAVIHCTDLWEAAGDVGRMVANLDRVGGGLGGRERSVGQAEALTQLALYRAQFSRYWDVFEDLVRFDTPATIAGRSLAEADGRRIEKCRLVVGIVASHIALIRRF